MSKFKDLPDWSQWILQKNADAEMEELNKAPMSGKVSPQRKSTKMTPPSTTVPKKEVKPAPPQGTKEKPVPIGERRNIKVSHEGEDNIYGGHHKFGVHKDGKKIATVWKDKHKDTVDDNDLEYEFTDAPMEDAHDGLEVVKEHVDKHKEHYNKDVVKKSNKFIEPTASENYDFNKLYNKEKWDKKIKDLKDRFSISGIDHEKAASPAPKKTNKPLRAVPENPDPKEFKQDIPAPTPPRKPDLKIVKSAREEMIEVLEKARAKLSPEAKAAKNKEKDEAKIQKLWGKWQKEYAKELLGRKKKTIKEVKPAKVAEQKPVKESLDIEPTHTTVTGTGKNKLYNGKPWKEHFEENWPKWKSNYYKNKKKQALAETVKKAIGRSDDDELPPPIPEEAMDNRAPVKRDIGPIGPSNTKLGEDLAQQQRQREEEERRKIEESGRNAKVSRISKEALDLIQRFKNDPEFRRAALDQNRRDTRESIIEQRERDQMKIEEEKKQRQQRIKRVLDMEDPQPTKQDMEYEKWVNQDDPDQREPVSSKKRKASFQNQINARKEAPINNIIRRLDNNKKE